MKRTQLIYVALCCFSTLSAQNNVYNGPYKLAVENANGTATYSYKEVNDERIKDGHFVFNSTGYEKINLNGFYKNGEKDGHWRVETQGCIGNTGFMMMRIKSNRQAFVQAGTKNIVEGNYRSGLKEGLWTLSKTSADYNYISKASFKDGKFYGVFTATASSTLYKSGDGLRKYSLNGQFVEGGLPDSLWVGKWMDDSGIEYMIKITFRKGRFTSLKASDLSTGSDISSKYSDYTYVSGRYAGKGIQEEWGNNLPSVFGELLGCWLWDETLMIDEYYTNKQAKYLYLDWDR